MDSDILCRGNYLYSCRNIKHKTKRIAYQLALIVVIKNCEPLESGPEFTIETTPAQKIQFQRNNSNKDVVQKP